MTPVIIGGATLYCGDETELGAAVSALRALNEETVLAGYPGGDREQTLANVRDMAQRTAGYARALAVIATASHYQAMDEGWARRHAKQALAAFDIKRGDAWRCGKDGL